MQVELNEEEREAILEILNHALPNLREEIRKTDNFEYRDRLKQQARVLRTVIARLTAASEAVASD